MLTRTDDPRVLMVTAVVDAPAQTVATRELLLVAIAVHVVQQDEPGPVSEVGIGGVGQGAATS